jgi:hypothetical protein
MDGATRAPIILTDNRQILTVISPFCHILCRRSPAKTRVMG